MSVLAKLKKNSGTHAKGLFGIVAGPRLGGKTTLAGTLPGKTLMLQAAVHESGSESAKAKAAEMGHELEVVNFTTVDDLQSVIKELMSDDEYDNVYVDSLSALTDMKLREPLIAKLVKTDNWGAFREIGNAATEVILGLKELTYSEKAKRPKNVFLTAALSIKTDKNGAVVDVSLECKGNVAVTAVTKFGEAVVTVLPAQQTEEGEIPHRLITKTQDFWPGRIDGILSHQNPGELPADLSAVLALRSGE
jgi:hypothetical protein